MSAAGLSRRLAAVRRVPEKSTRDAAAAVIKLARAQGAKVGAVTLGKKRRRYPLGATTRHKGGGASYQATVWGKPTGPWVWANTGAGGHTIPRGGRRRRSKPRYLKGAGYAHPIGRPVQHPGRSGSGAWRTVQDQARREVPKVFHNALRVALGGGGGG